MDPIIGPKHHLNSPISYIFHRQHSENELRKNLFLRQRLSLSSNLYRKDLRGHFGCVNAIEFSHNGGEWIASGGDDKRVLLWNTEKVLSSAGSPQQMKAEHNSNIFCLSFDNGNRKIFSGGNDEQVTVHDISRGEAIDVFMHEEAVYGLSVHPFNDSVFASACDDGRVLIFDVREQPSTDPFCLANSVAPMHAVMYNPVEPRLLATANSKEGIGLWDIRKPRNCVLRYGGSLSQQSCMSVRISQTGDRIIALRRRLPPILYQIHSPKALFQFDHAGYYNSCTMKSCCFAGDRDQYLISGSDDFNLYMWKIPDDKTETSWISNAHLVLKGHRSIVNQVRFNPANHLVISSGVEKVIKCWSPFQLPDSEGSHEIEPDDLERSVYTHEEYINLVLRSGQVMSHDYSNQSTEEDPRMMAFFDSLVQRELEEWSTDDSLSSNDEFYSRFMQASHSDESVRDSGSHSEDGFSPFTLAFASVVTNVNQNQEGEANLLDLDDHSARIAASVSQAGPADQGDEQVLEGQRPGQSRRSISGLIAQKRREYLMNLKRAHDSDSKTKHKRLKILKQIDSSSESSGHSKGKKRKKQTSRSPNSSSTESNSDRESDRKLPVLFRKQNKKPPHLKRLSQLRALIANDNSSDSESELDKTKIKSKEFVSSSDSSSDNEKAETMPCTKVKSSRTCDAVPSTSGVSLKGKGSSSETVPCGKVKSSRTCDAVPSTSGVSLKGKGNSSEEEGLYGPYLEGASHKQECGQSSDHKSDPHSDCNKANATGAKCKSSNSPQPSCEPGPSRTSAESSANGQGPSHSSDITWSEFKKFRNRLERARRYYRRRSQPDESTDDED